MFSKVSIVFVLVASLGAVLAAPHAPSSYNFEYGVTDGHTGDKKSQSESGHGGVVKGHYSLLEADGSTRTVHYTADPHHGFTAEVSRNGHLTHAGAYPVIPASHATPVPPVVAAAPHYGYHSAPAVAHYAPAVPVYNHVPAPSYHHAAYQAPAPAPEWSLGPHGESFAAPVGYGHGYIKLARH